MADWKKKPDKEKEDMDFLKGAEDNLDGFEEINAATMAIPFIKLAQKLTPETKKNKAQFIRGLEEGNFFNSVTKEIYGDEVNLIVLKFERIYIEWLPKREGFVDYHSVERAEQIAEDKTFGKWKTKSGNLLQENYVYFVLAEDHVDEGPAVLSLSSTQIKKAKEWNRLMTTHIMDNGRRALPYYIVWNVSTVPMTNDQGDWFGLSITFDRYINKNEYEVLQPERKALPDKRVDYAQIEGRVDEDADGDEEEIEY